MLGDLIVSACPGAIGLRTITKSLHVQYRRPLPLGEEIRLWGVSNAWATRWRLASPSPHTTKSRRRPGQAWRVRAIRATSRQEEHWVSVIHIYGAGRGTDLRDPSMVPRDARPSTSGDERMQLEDMILVSVDDHLVEPPSMSDFFMASLPRQVPRPGAHGHHEGRRHRCLARPGPRGRELRSQRGRGSCQHRSGAWTPATSAKCAAGTYDVHERVRDMNINGVLGSMCFSSWPGLGGQYFLQSGDPRARRVHDPRRTTTGTSKSGRAPRPAASSRSRCRASCSAPSGWRARSAASPRRAATRSRSTPRCTASACPTTTATSGTRRGRRATTPTP